MSLGALPAESLVKCPDSAPVAGHGPSKGGTFPEDSRLWQGQLEILPLDTWTQHWQDSCTPTSGAPARNCGLQERHAEDQGSPARAGRLSASANSAACGALQGLLQLLPVTGAGTEVAGTEVECLGICAHSCAPWSSKANEMLAQRLQARSTRLVLTSHSSQSLARLISPCIGALSPRIFCGSDYALTSCLFCIWLSI